ncbi:MAG TPA: hypothetical protein DDW84_04615 [Phycisphaerales bacterium]|nr:MAG: hypothetical protein A2Y13_11885 [Planctomycetes bacterium GWC2_45_44]HBG78119.1 hypothetical protein [Phycisphaerales bacterium]HBR19083.1 hypothetical protein [Phycisphaerales bacterium]
MFSNHVYVWAVLVLLTLGNGLAVSDVDIWQNTYYAELGTLPTTQGWPLFEGDGSSPDPTVVNGILHQGPTSTTEYQAWVKDGAFCHFRGPVPFVMECKLKVISSNFVDYGYGWGPGWHCTASDKDKSYFALGITQTGVRLTNTSRFSYNSAESSPLVALDTTSDFKVYRLIFFNGLGQLYVNGVLIVTLPIGSINDHSSFLVFGDPHPLTTSEVEIEYVRFGIISEPSDLNTDGVVDFVDFANFASDWLESSCGLPDWCNGHDFDQNGNVGMTDLAEIAEHWLEEIW